MIGLAPGSAALRVTIECTRRPADRFGVQHEVRLHADGTVTAPHDLDAERVAAGFGGWCACQHVADVVAPALRHTLSLMDDPGLLAGSEGAWAVSAAPRCPLGAHVHATREEAVRHESSAEHVAARVGDGRDRHRDAATRRLYESVRDAARQAWVAAVAPGILVNDARDADVLWRAGVLPTRATALARALPAEVGPLAVDAVAHVHFARSDPALLVALAEVFPTRDFVAWAARGRDDATLGEARALRGLAVSARDAIGVLEAGVAADAVASLASEAGLAASTAARWLAVWSTIDARPHAEHYVRLLAHGATLALPRRATLDAVCAALRPLGGAAPSRTETAVMLALGLSAADIRGAAHRGIRTVTDPRLSASERPRRTR